jgi:peptide/nickel transport system permease protein
MATTSWQPQTAAPWRTRLARAGRILAENKLFAAGLLVFAVLLVAFSAPGLLATHHPFTTSAAETMQGPSAAHWLGTDTLGRDVYSRIVHGTRASLLVAFAAVALALLAGTATGLVAGYLRGVADQLLGRVMDVVFSLPPLLLAIAIAGILGPSVRNATIAIAVVYTPHFFRVARSGALSESARPYVTAERVIGASGSRILFRHVLPNSASQIVVQMTVTLAYAILLEASLSFLGLGVQPPTPSWGSILNEGRPYLQIVPWLSIFPGLMILLAVMAVNLVGDSLRDLWDPKGGR